MLRRTLIVATLVSMIVVLSFGAAFAAKPNRNDAPVVTAFDVEPASASPVPVLTFTATDSDGSVTGYLVTESSSEPSANDPGWSPTAPTSYTTASVGLVTLYAWARDDKDAVSASMSDTVDIPLPPIDADTLQGHPASDFAATIHTHNTADVNGLDASLAAKADQVDVIAALTTKADTVHSHFHGNMTVVATSGGEYTSPVDAINGISNWCGNPSATNPCLVKVMPGVYDIGSTPVVLPANVDMEGSGKNTTIIKGICPSVGGSNQGVVGVTDSEVRSMTIDSYGQLSWRSYAVSLEGSGMSLKDVRVLARNGIRTAGVWALPSNEGFTLNLDDVEILVTAHPTSNDSTQVWGLIAQLNGPPFTVNLKDTSIIVVSENNPVNGTAIETNGNHHTMELDNVHLEIHVVNGVSIGVKSSTTGRMKMYNSKIVSSSANSSSYGTSGGYVDIVNSEIYNEGIWKAAIAASNSDPSAVSTLVNSKIQGDGMFLGGTLLCLGNYDENLQPVTCP